MLKSSKLSEGMSNLLKDAIDDLGSIKYGHLATLHLYFDLNSIEQSKLRQLVDDKVLHLLIPDSFYKGQEDCKFEIQQYHLMSNLFPD